MLSLESSKAEDVRLSASQMHSKEVFLGFQSHLESVDKDKIEERRALEQVIRVDTDMSGLLYPICVCGLN